MHHYKSYYTRVSLYSATYCLVTKKVSTENVFVGVRSRSKYKYNCYVSLSSILKAAEHQRSPSAFPYTHIPKDLHPLPLNHLFARDFCCCSDGAEQERHTKRMANISKGKHTMANPFSCGVRGRRNASASLPPPL